MNNKRYKRGVVFAKTPPQFYKRNNMRNNMANTNARPNKLGYIDTRRGINERVQELSILRNIRMKRAQDGRDTTRLDKVIEQREGVALELLRRIRDE